MRSSPKGITDVFNEGEKIRATMSLYVVHFNQICWIWWNGRAPDTLLGGNSMARADA